MKRINSFGLAIALFLSAAGITVHADGTPALDFRQETPLMVIRFNQLRIDYADPLYDTVSRALKAKPSAVFDIVSIAPRAKDKDSQAYNNKLAERHLYAVLKTLHDIGLPSARVSAASALDDVSAGEVRIFIH